MNDTKVLQAKQGLTVAAQAGLLAGPFLSMVDSNIVNVALPDIATQLHTSLETVQWIISGYLLALAAVLATSAYLEKRFGTRRVYLASLVGFSFASALCALAPSIGFLIAVRALQGAFGAPLVPLAMGMLHRGGRTQQFPPAAAITLFLAPAIGPTLGGFLIHLYGWPLIFLINVPFGILGIIGVLRGIPEQPVTWNPAEVHLDWFGILLLGSGLVSAIYGATEGPQYGWLSIKTLPYLVVGLILLFAYVIWALLYKQPAVDLKLLRRSQTALAVAIGALAAIVLFVMLFLIPIFMEDVQHVSPIDAGLSLLPQGLVTGIGIGIGGRLATQRGVRFTVALGMFILTLGTAAMLWITFDTPAWVTALLLSTRGLALGLTIQPLLNMMIGSLQPQEVPDGNTLFNVTQRLGGSIGIPLLATFFSLRETTRILPILQTHGIHINPTILNQQGSLDSLALPSALKTQIIQASVDGFHDTIWLLILFSAFGCLISLLLRGKKESAGNRERSAVADKGLATFS